MTCIVNGDRRRSDVDGKDSWFRVFTPSKGNKILERLINLFAKQAKLGTSNRLF